MPLTRGKVVGYDVAKMTFRFTMLNEGETVECEISSAALDELAGGKGTALAAREPLFLLHRTEVERFAANIFDDGLTVQGAVVRIFAKHIRR
jgi:hypothetical protein